MRIGMIDTETLTLTAELIHLLDMVKDLIYAQEHIVGTGYPYVNMEYVYSEMRVSIAHDEDSETLYYSSDPKAGEFTEMKVGTIDEAVNKIMDLISEVLAIADR